MQLRPPIALTASGALVCALLASSCSNEYRIKLIYPDDAAWARAQRAELIVAEGSRCQALGSGQSVPAEDLIAQLDFVARDAAPSIGQLRYGRLTFFAQVRDRDCLAFAAGCVEQEIEPRQDTLVEIALVPRTEVGCPSGTSCSGGTCVVIADAGVDAAVAEAGQDSARDAARDAGHDAAFDDLGNPDVGRDAGVDAAHDAAIDAATDAALDAAEDAARDAGSDAGRDAGVGWLDQAWQYRRPIIVTEHSGEELLEYQIEVVLGSSNFDFSHAQPDGRDIRFTASDGITEQHYWIEKWDNDEPAAVVWVRVTAIAALGNAWIYIYHGNAMAPAASSGSATFDLFDDFEDGNYTADPAWTVAGQTVSIEATAPISGMFSLKLVRSGEDAKITAPFVTGVDRHVLEVKEHLIRATDSVFRTEFSNSTGLVHGSHDGILNRISSGIDQSGRGCSGTSGRVGGVTDTAIHLFRLSWYTSTSDPDIEYAEARFVGEDPSPIHGCGTDTHPGELDQLNILAGGNSLDVDGAFLDDVRIRKYASAEPSVSVGGEQSH